MRCLRAAGRRAAGVLGAGPSHVRGEDCGVCAAGARRAVDRELRRERARGGDAHGSLAVRSTRGIPKVLVAALRLRGRRRWQRARRSDQLRIARARGCSRADVRPGRGLQRGRRTHRAIRSVCSRASRAHSRARPTDGHRASFRSRPRARRRHARQRGWRQRPPRPRRLALSGSCCWPRWLAPTR
jgi:hypothetical protein